MHKSCNKNNHPICKHHNKHIQEEEKKPVEPIKKTYDTIKNLVEPNAPIRHR